MIFSNKRSALVAVLIFILSLVLPTLAFSRVVGAFSGIWAISTNGWDSVDLPVVDYSHYNYAANDSRQSNGLFSVFVGWEDYFNEDWAIEVGASYFSQAIFTIQGTLTQGIDIQSSSAFDYRYRIKSQALLLDTKWIYYWRNDYHPYFIVGIGAGQNSSEGYQADIPPCTTFTPQFANNDKLSFAYSVGFGMDYDINEQMRFGIGYRFFDFGQASLGNALIDTVPTTHSVTQGHLIQSMFLAQLTYLFS